MKQQPLFGRFQNATPTSVPTEQTAAPPRIYTVSEFVTESKTLLEKTFPAVWVEGEISSLTIATSGHTYFCLKDDSSQVKAVLWKSVARYMRWRPKNGMKVMISGRVTIFESRGEFQIDVQQIVPHGKGDLYAAFEQLKEKLRLEGLFDAKRKRAIPILPKKIGIVTSPSGAVIRDILNILKRRYVNLHVLIYPAKVQGEEAAPTIVEGIRALNRFKDIDVLILARGGGSIEDLWPFNEEMVARAIVASRIPVISAVGHETDTTIADFVADLRAATPSAAAEQVIGKKSEFIERLDNHSQRMLGAIRTFLLQKKHRVNSLSQHRSLSGIPQRIRTDQQKVDDLDLRLRNGPERYRLAQTRRLLLVQNKLSPAQLLHFIQVKRSRLTSLSGTLRESLRSLVGKGHRNVAGVVGKLDSLSPLAVLERGYSIVSNEEGEILKESQQATPGMQVRVRLHRGKLNCEVKEVDHE